MPRIIQARFQAVSEGLPPIKKSHPTAQKKGTTTPREVIAMPNMDYSDDPTLGVYYDGTLYRRVINGTEYVDDDYDSLYDTIADVTKQE